MHETPGFGVNLCGVIALGGAHGLAEGVGEVAVMQRDPGSEKGEYLVRTSVGDEDVEILCTVKMSKGCPVPVLRSCTHLLCDVEFTAHDGKLAAASVTARRKLAGTRTAMSSHSRSARIRANRCSTSSTSSIPAQSATEHRSEDSQSRSDDRHDSQEMSRVHSFSHAFRPACAKTFRLGLRPTASRLDVALTRKVRRKRMRGCVTWRTTGADFGKGICAARMSARA